jgi:hypothetical protein
VLFSGLVAFKGRVTGVGSGLEVFVGDVPSVVTLDSVVGALLLGCAEVPLVLGGCGTGAGFGAVVVGVMPFGLERV